MPAALQNHGKAAAWKTSVARVQKHRNSCYFCPVTKILPTKRPPFWGPETDSKMEATHSVSTEFACVRTTWPPFWGPFVDPKTGAVCRQIFCRLAKNSASFDCFRRCATEVLHTAGPLGSHGFAAPRAIVLHALRTFMPTHVLELGRPSVAGPVFARVFGPQTGVQKNHFFDPLKEPKVWKTCEG